MGIIIHGSKIVEGGSSEPAPAEKEPESPAAPEAPATPEPEKKEDPAPAEPAAPGEAPAEEPAPAAAKAYEPNLKFKVLDKEHEIDAFLKDAIKDEASEKRVKELYEKAFGLEVVKPKYQSLKTEHEELQAQHSGIIEGLNEVREMVAVKDFDSFFTRLKIPHEWVLQWVVDKVKYQELPPEQKNAIDARQQAERQARELQKSSQLQERQYFQQLSQAKGRLLDMALERAEIKAFAEAYDTKAGKPGAFRDAVCDYGDAVFRTKEVDLSPEQAIQDVMAHYGKFFASSSPAASPAAPATNPAAPAAPAGKQEPPVIPNVTGRQTSPTTSTSPTSIDDLRKIRKQMLEGQSA